MLERENLPRAAHTGTGLEVAVKSPVQLAGNPTLACQEFKENKLIHNCRTIEQPTQHSGLNNPGTSRKLRHVDGNCRGIVKREILGNHVHQTAGRVLQACVRINTPLDTDGLLHAADIRLVTETRCCTSPLSAALSEGVRIGPEEVQILFRVSRKCAAQIYHRP